MERTIHSADLAHSGLLVVDHLQPHQAPVRKLVQLIVADVIRKDATQLRIVQPTSPTQTCGVYYTFNHDEERQLMKPPAKLYPSMRAFIRYISGLGIEAPLFDAIGPELNAWQGFTLWIKMKRQGKLPPPSTWADLLVRLMPPQSTLHLIEEIRFHVQVHEHEVILRLIADDHDPHSVSPPA